MRESSDQPRGSSPRPQRGDHATLLCQKPRHKMKGRRKGHLLALLPYTFIKFFFRDVNEAMQREERWVPSSGILDAAVHPLLRAVGARPFADIRRRAFRFGIDACGWARTGRGVGECGVGCSRRGRLVGGGSSSEYE